jgi:hypothetical protein
MVIARYMRFVETKVFTKRLVRIADDEAFRRLQVELAANPEKGPVIQGTGGLRKVRMPARGKGKSGGARVIYLYLAGVPVIHLVYAYDKGEAEDLTPDEKQELKTIVDAIKKEYRDES